MQASYENIPDTESAKRLGKAPARSHPKMLAFSDYAKANIVVPEKTTFWKKRKGFTIRTYGNDEFGCCTKASQAVMATKMERIECRKTINITDKEITDNYLKMTARLYGGGDTGAYELDALNEWRNPDLTFRDTKGHPLTIDAYTKINHSNIAEVKTAVYMSGSHGIKVGFSLPAAFQGMDYWTINETQQPIGKYLPGSWGGHSMTAILDYDKDYLYLDHTWGIPPGKISWLAFSIYCDEAYSIVDSADAWKKRLGKKMNVSKLISDVNNVSELKIK